MFYFVLLISIIVSVHYFYFLIRTYYGIGRVPENLEKTEKEYISVIIPFRNESDSILESLKSLEGQMYPTDKFEALYVNDMSTDDSPYKLKQNIRNSNINVIDIQKEERTTSAFKKMAIMKALKSAKGKIIVTTDADCVHKPTWLEEINNAFDEKTGMVTGPVVFKNDESLFTKLQALEFASLVMMGAGLIHSKFPIMCNAANLAYRKNVYDEVNGYEGNMKISSGDDVYLMQKIDADTKYEIKYLKSLRALVTTNPNRNIQEFLNQRKRWASKSLFYNSFGLVFELFLIFCFYLSFFYLILFGFFEIKYFYILTITFLIKIISEFLVVSRGFKHLMPDFRYLMRYFFVAEMVHIPYIIISGIGGAMGNFDWKGREIKR